MNTFSRAVCFISLLGASFPAFAGQDPIGWSASRDLDNPAIIGRTYSVRYTLTNNLPLQLVKPLNIIKASIPASEFSYTDGCSGETLASGASCFVDVVFAPTTSGNKTLQLIVAGYDDNKVPLPKLTTVVNGDTSPSNSVYGNTDTSLPANVAVGSDYKYSFTFTNGTNAALSGVSVDVTQSTGTETSTTTCGSTLGAGKSCVVTGSYVPRASTPTTQSVTATLNYTGGSVSQSSSGGVTSSSGVTAFFTGNNYLPAQMVGGAGNSKTIQVEFFNNTSSTITVSSQPTLTVTTGGGSATLTVDPAGATNNCFIGAQQVAPQSGCIITGTFVGNVVGAATDVVVTGSMSYTGAAGSPVSRATSTELVPSLSTSRTISLVNNCDFPVWWSFSGSAVAGTDSASCPAGTTANQVKGSGECHWTNPAPNTGTSYMLAATTGTNTATIPLNAGTDPKIQWSGTISASLRCGESGSTFCQVAPCDNNNGTTACKSGQGFIGPATLAEFTFNIATDDSYDVTVINGFHIPISITPGSNTSPDNYECGIPGGFIAGNGFGSCNWENAVVPGKGYYMVEDGGAPCDITSSTNACGGTELCGIALAQDTASKTVVMGEQRCGKFLGYWTADEICGMNPAKGSTIETFFQCLTPLTGSAYPSGAVYQDLMKCAVPTGDVQPLYNTCYMTYSGASATQIASCCGCKDWWTVAGISANQNTASCTPSQGAEQTNPIWNSVMQGQVEWLKKTCPSVYVYPFDDKTSGFSCTNNLPNQSNSTNYTITFCPGNTGKPAGIDDGRIP